MRQSVCSTHPCGRDASESKGGLESGDKFFDGMAENRETTVPPF
jgi:hypothetical protein